MNNLSVNGIIRQYRTHYPWRYRLLFLSASFGVLVISSFLIFLMLVIDYPEDIKLYLLSSSTFFLALEHYLYKRYSSNDKSHLSEGVRLDERDINGMSPKEIIDSFCYSHPWTYFPFCVSWSMGLCVITAWIIFPLYSIPYNSYFYYVFLGFGIIVATIDVLLNKK